MNIQIDTRPLTLDRYCFLWSEVRLLVAAAALFFGGVPVIHVVLPIFALTTLLLLLAWVISGVAAGYLAYRWATHGFKLFGKTETKDRLAFLVMIVSGINLGLTGITGQNPGMSISTNYLLFIVTGIAYLVSAYHLHSQWRAHGKRLF